MEWWRRARHHSVSALRHTVVALVLGATGVTLPLAASRAFTAFTTDTARAQDVARTPRTVPPAMLRDASGAWRALIPPDTARVRIVGFMATRCVTLCAQQHGVFQQLQREILARGLRGQVELVSVSFDPAWDTPRALGYFAIAQRPDARVWRVLAPPDTVVSNRLLETFGVRVITEGTELVHNAALHVVNASGQLVAIFPIDAIEDALSTAEALTGSLPRADVGSTAQ